MTAGRFGGAVTVVREVTLRTHIAEGRGLAIRARCALKWDGNGLRFTLPHEARPSIGRPTTRGRGLRPSDARTTRGRRPATVFENGYRLGHPRFDNLWLTLQALPGSMYSQALLRTTSSRQA